MCGTVRTGVGAVGAGVARFPPFCCVAGVGLAVAVRFRLFFPAVLPVVWAVFLAALSAV